MARQRIPSYAIHVHHLWSQPWVGNAQHRTQLLAFVTSPSDCPHQDSSREQTNRFGKAKTRRAVDETLCQTKSSLSRLHDRSMSPHIKTQDIRESIHPLQKSRKEAQADASRPARGEEKQQDTKFPTLCLTRKPSRYTTRKG